MTKKNLLTYILALATTLTIISCNSHSQFIIEGHISNADSSTLYLVKRTITDVNIIDSVKLDKNGKFRFRENKSTPDFYYLSLNNQIINLAVDSTETVQIEANKTNFSSDYTVEGSEASSRIKDASLEVSKLSQNLNKLKKELTDKVISDAEYMTQAQASIKKYKENTQKLMLADLKSLSAYFILFQKVDGYLIYDAYDKQDNKMFAAVATSWDIYHKGEPRATHLHDYVIKAMQSRRSMDVENMKINNAGETDPSTYFNVKLPNLKGDIQDLSTLRGKVVLLDFTVYQASFSPQYISALNQLYKKYKGKLEIYQVSFDSDLHFWQNAASNLPWICVRDEQSMNSSLINKFNIQDLPTTYLLDKNGNVAKKISIKEDINTEIQKLL